MVFDKSQDEKVELVKENRSSNTKLQIAIIWAVIASAMVIVLVIGGAVFYTGIDDEDVTVIDEDTWMDNKRNTELKLVKNEDGLIQIIGALDYTSGRLILYSPQSEACYIMPHLNVTEKDKELSPEKENAVIDLDVTDQDIIDGVDMPPQLELLCKDKHLYLLKKHLGESGMRVKRGEVKVKVKIGPVEVEVKVTW